RARCARSRSRLSPWNQRRSFRSDGPVSAFCGIDRPASAEYLPVMSLPRLIAGLSEIAPHHDALICDVWGVVHDGQRHHAAAADALYRFKERHGPVVLLTNAPRVPAEVAAQCASYGLPPDCYDAIVSSGGAAREEMARRSADHCLAIHYIGPDRDLPMI